MENFFTVDVNKFKFITVKNHDFFFPSFSS